MTLCERCNGACCRYVITAVPDSSADNAALLVLRGGRFAKGVVFLPLKCERLDAATGKCMAYDERLDFCRNFRSGSVDCLACRRLENQQRSE